MKYVIYQIRCKSTSKVYVGKHKTVNLDDGYMGSGKLLLRAIKKHGVENFEKTILHVFEDEESMNLKEAELVTEEFCARDDTYNLCPGGKGGWGYVNSQGLAAGGNPSSAGKKATNQSEAGSKGITFLWETRREEMLKIAERARSLSSGTLGKKYKQKNHNPASHPRGPRGPYKKKFIPE